MAHGGDPAGAEELAQAGDERRGRGGGGARESGQVRAETGVDDELFAALGFGELEEEDAGGEVVDVGEAEGDELRRELVGDDLEGYVVLKCVRVEELVGVYSTFTSKDEKRCFIVAIAAAGLCVQRSVLCGCR